MKTSVLTIVIPGEIVALPSLSLAERVALAHLHKWPGSTNVRLAKVLGFSERGVESLLRRLRERGLIQQKGKGRARVLRLMFAVEHHTKCGNTRTMQCAAESHTKCGGGKAAPRTTAERGIAPVSKPVQAPYSRKPNADINAIRRFLIARGLLIVEQVQQSPAVSGPQG